ncbi:MAG: hypothetical protein FWC26_09165 [Fibromonadales bacterium]|nr:hypothetical protein [Fibromonadales bacterium]
MRIFLILFLASFAFANDFFRHPQNGAKNYNESWDYVFVLDNGAKAYVSYTWMNVPGSGQKIGTQFSVWNLNGKSTSVGRQYPTERFHEDKSSKTINIKNEYLMENLPGKGHRVFFSAEKNGKFFLDLKFTSADAAQIPDNEVFNVNGQKYGLYVHIPYGRVEGRIGINGDTVSVKGYGYMDHSWLTDAATNMAARSLLFASPNKDRIAGRINISPKGEIYGYAISNKTSKPVFPAEILEGESAYNPQKFPKGLTIKWKNEEIDPLKIEIKIQEKFSILANADGFVERQLIKATMGEIFYLRGRAQTEPWGRVDWILSGK